MDQRSWDSKISARTCDIAIDNRAKRFHRLRCAWCDDCVCIEKTSRQACSFPKQSQCRRAACSKARPILTRETKLLTWSMSISVQPELMKRYKELVKRARQCRETCDCSESTGRLVAQDNTVTSVVPTQLSTTTKPLLTNETVQGDVLLEYERKFANLPDDIKLIRLCSNAGFIKTVSEGQYFVTLDDAELAKLGGSCREYTSPRDDQVSQVKGWIRGNTKIGPVLGVAVS